MWRLGIPCIPCIPEGLESEVSREFLLSDDNVPKIRGPASAGSRHESHAVNDDSTMPKAGYNSMAAIRKSREGKLDYSLDTIVQCMGLRPTYSKERSKVCMLMFRPSRNKDLPGQVRSPAARRWPRSQQPPECGVPPASGAHWKTWMLTILYPISCARMSSVL